MAFLELFFALFAHIIKFVEIEAEWKQSYNSSESYSCYSEKKSLQI